MELIITLPDEYQHMIDVIIADTEKQNPDRDDVTIDTILAQKCREVVLGLHDQIMIGLPNPGEARDRGVHNRETVGSATGCRNI